MSDFLNKSVLLKESYGIVNTNELARVFPFELENDFYKCWYDLSLKPVLIPKQIVESGEIVEMKFRFTKDSEPVPVEDAIRAMYSILEK